MSIRDIDDAQNFKIDLSARAGRQVDELQSLQQMISVQHRQRFVRKIFNGNSNEFERLIAQLEDIPNWAEAHQTMKDYFSAHYLNPYQEEAICLTDIVYKRYFPLDFYIQPQF